MKKQLLALTTAITTLSSIGFTPSAQAEFSHNFYCSKPQKPINWKSYSPDHKWSCVCECYIKRNDNSPKNLEGIEEIDHPTHERFYNELELTTDPLTPGYTDYLDVLKSFARSPNDIHQNEDKWQARGEKACEELEQSGNSMSTVIDRQITKGKNTADKSKLATPAIGFNNHVAPYLAAAFTKCPKFSDFARIQLQRINDGRVDI
jgi:hypothetical protein